MSFQFLWLNSQKTVKTDAWALELYSTNSVGLRFREVVEKIKEKARQKTNLKNLQNGQEKYGGKKLAYVQIWGKTSKIL